MKPNPYHFEMLSQGAERWNQWRRDSQVMTPELAGAELSEFALSRYRLAGADLREANLCRANLSMADLSDANLSMTYLIEANLFGTTLSKANCVRANMAKANFFAADLSNADLAEANLSRANLVLANLTNVNLTRANLSLADLTKAHLERAMGLQQEGDGGGDSSSGALLTPPMVHAKMDLISMERLGGLKSVQKADPIRVRIGMDGAAGFHGEKTLFMVVCDLLNVFGFDLIENPEISGSPFRATLRCVGKACNTPEKVKGALADMRAGFSRMLENTRSSAEPSPQQIEAIEACIGAIRSMPHQLILQIDCFVIIQSFQDDNPRLRVHEISETLRDEFVNDPDMLNSPHVVDKLKGFR